VVAITCHGSHSWHCLHFLHMPAARNAFMTQTLKMTQSCFERMSRNHCSKIATPSEGAIAPRTPCDKMGMEKATLSRALQLAPHGLVQRPLQFGLHADGVVFCLSSEGLGRRSPKHLPRQRQPNANLANGRFALPPCSQHAPCEH